MTLSAPRAFRRFFRSFLQRIFIMKNEVSRRIFLNVLSAGLSAAAVSSFATVDASGALAADETPSTPLDPNRVRFCLNLGTIRNYELKLNQELEVARDAGYRSVEIWFDRLSDYARSADGKGFDKDKLAELRKFSDGEGLTIESAIGFASWIVDDPERRAAGVDELKRQAEALAILGAKHVAAPAAGANERIDLSKVAERYRTVLEACEPFGVRPLLELWGASPALSRISDGLAVCADTGRADAALLLDVYHLYRGGNSFSALSLIAGAALPIFHMNDYPSSPEREKLSDGDRVFPGDGAAPWRQIIATLGKNGFDGVFSFEIFNREYARRYSAVEQAKIGLEKMRALLA